MGGCGFLVLALLLDFIEFLNGFKMWWYNICYLCFTHQRITVYWWHDWVLFETIFCIIIASKLAWLMVIMEPIVWLCMRAEEEGLKKGLGTLIWPLFRVRALKLCFPTDLVFQFSANTPNWVHFSLFFVFRFAANQWPVALMWNVSMFQNTELPFSVVSKFSSNLF